MGGDTNSVEGIEECGGEAEFCKTLYAHLALALPIRHLSPTSMIILLLLVDQHQTTKPCVTEREASAILRGQDAQAVSKPLISGG